MTHRTDVALSRDLGARWRVLAERRLEYLTELFESGRWRRYYSERAFLENIQEAKAAVAHWRDLSKRQIVAEKTPNGEVPATPQAAPIIVEPPPAARPAAAPAASDEIRPAPAPAELPEDPAHEPKMTQERYALLRNMF